MGAICHPDGHRSARARDCGRAWLGDPGVRRDDGSSLSVGFSRDLTTEATTGAPGLPLKQPKSGTFWWRSPSNQTYRVTNQATDDLREWSPCERALLWRFDEQPPPA